MREILNQIRAELKFLKDSQTKIESRISQLESLLITKPSPIRQPENQPKKPGWKPYFDINALMDYCDTTGIHPCDLTSEEMNKFRLRERTRKRIMPLGERSE